MTKDINTLAAMGRQFRARKHGHLSPKRINTRRLDVFKLTEAALKQGTVFRPMFMTEALNDCVISKEVVPETLKHIYKPHQLATKVYFPYAEDAQTEETSGIGGKAININEMNFEKKLEINFIGSQPDEVKEHDIAMLQVFDTLPSLDPFLIRDKFQIEDIEVAEIYFEIDKKEWEYIKSRVVNKFRPLAEIAYGADSKNKDVERNTVRLVENPIRQGLALLGIRLRRTARNLAVDQTVRPLGVEPQHPVPNNLLRDTTEFGRGTAPAAVVHDRQRQKPAGLTTVGADLGQSAKRRPVEVVAKRDRC
jgi:hypothetical protein